MWNYVEIRMYCTLQLLCALTLIFVFLLTLDILHSHFVCSHFVNKITYNENDCDPVLLNTAWISLGKN